MAITVQEDLMAVGAWSVDLDNTPKMKAALVDDAGKPRKLHMLLYRASDDQLVYVGVLLEWSGGEEGLTIGGGSPLWHLGAGPGPLIADREYVSGFDKLSNGPFDLVDVDGRALYWREPAEGSLWTFDGGKALNVGGLGKDDVLESDEKFPTRPGYSYQLNGIGETGAGYLRHRLVFEGRFNPPDILVDGGFDNPAAWTLDPTMSIVGGQLVAGPIPRPELIPPSGADFSVGWTIGPTMWIAGGQLLLQANPKPDFLAHDSSDFTSSPFVTYSVADPLSLSGSGDVLVVGPIAQEQFVVDPGFDDPTMAGYSQLSGTWTYDATQGLGGSGAACTSGPGSPDAKVLVSDFDPGTAGTQALALQPGDEVRVRGTAKGESGGGPPTNGTIYFTIHLKKVVADIPVEQWLRSPLIASYHLIDGQWTTEERTVVIPDDLPFADALIEVVFHTTGLICFDNFSLTRIRGNNTGIYSDAFPAVVGQTYTLRTLANSDQRITGTVTPRLIFEGPGVEPIEFRGGAQSYTFQKWVSLDGAEGACPQGYETVKGAFDGDDLQGGSMRLDVANTKLEKTDNNTDRATYLPVPVTEGQWYLLGASFLSLAEIKGGSATVGVTLSGPGVDDETISIEYTFADDDGTGTPQRKTVDVTPRPGYTSATGFVSTKDLSGGDAGAFIAAVQQFTLTKMDNNTATASGTSITVVPERTYHWEESASSNPDLQGGTVKLSARCIRAGHEDMVFDSPEMAATDAATNQITLDFTPPSGYDEFIPDIVSRDILGGVFALDNGSIRDTDSTTAAFDAVTINPAGGDSFVAATAPAGAEFVRGALVAQEGSAGWSVKAATLTRTGVTPATGDAIIADLVLDPVTGQPLSLAVGDVDCPEVIPYDWRLLNLTNRAALDHYCSVVSEPVREYRVNPGLPPTLDVGRREDIFTDHSAASDNPITLLARDIDVKDLGPGQTNVSERATHIQVIGAERQTLSGRTILITATAAVPGPVELDFNNRPIVRTKQVSDGTVDHFGYAQALADDAAEREAAPPVSKQVTLSGDDTRGPLDVGDWVYAYDSASGLEDQTNPQMIEGEQVYPQRLRVLSGLRTFGPGYYVLMRKPDGSTFPLVDTNESDEDSTTLTLGDRLPTEWEADPQGGATSVQYLRDRASRPR